MARSTDFLSKLAPFQIAAEVHAAFRIAGSPASLAKLQQAVAASDLAYRPSGFRKVTHTPAQVAAFNDAVAAFFAAC